MQEKMIGTAVVHILHVILDMAIVTMIIIVKEI